MRHVATRHPRGGPDMIMRITWGKPFFVGDYKTYRCDVKYMQ